MKKEKQPSVNIEALRLLHEPLAPQADPTEQHERLLEIDTELTYDPDALSDEPGIEIIADDKIVINGIAIAVNTASKRFIFNELRKWQGYPLTRSDIQDAGYRGSYQSFAQSINDLQQATAQAAGKFLIESEWGAIQRSGGRHRLYTLLPEVPILDRRADWRELSLKERLLRTSVHMDSKGAPIIQEGRVAFKGFRYRVQVASRMVVEFKEAAGAEELFKALPSSLRLFKMDPGMIRRPYSAEAETAELTIDRQKRIFREIDQALCAYVTTKDTPEAAKSETIKRGVRACFDLFYAGLRDLHLFAIRQSSSQLPFAELYQAGAEDLMQQILGHAEDSEETFLGLMTFRYNWLKKALLGQGMQSIDHYAKLRGEIKKVRHYLRTVEEANKPSPSIDQLCEEFSKQKTTMLGIMALIRSPVELDRPLEVAGDTLEPSGLVASLAVEDAIEAELTSMEREDSMDILFKATELTDHEKIILSIYYQVFHPALCGAEVLRPDREPFIYPYTKEAFQELVAKELELKEISTDLFGKHDGYAKYRHQTALRKARGLLASFDGLEFYGNHRSTDPEEDARQEALLEEERQALIKEALTVSPHKALTNEDIRKLRREKKFSVTAGRIDLLFGSVPDFGVACGFEHEKRSATRQLTNQDIIDMALALSPGRPLTAAEIHALSAEGKFVSIYTLKKRWGDRKTFNRECGFTDT